MTFFSNKSGPGLFDGLLFFLFVLFIIYKLWVNNPLTRADLAILTLGLLYFIVQASNLYKNRKRVSKKILEELDEK